MALLRTLRLSGHVLDHAVDWDRRTSTWRVEIRFDRGRVGWFWFADLDKATMQRWYAEARRKR